MSFYFSEPEGRLSFLQRFSSLLQEHYVTEHLEKIFWMTEQEFKIPDQVECSKSYME